MISLTAMVDIIVDVLTVIKESHLQVKIFTAIIWSPNCTQEMASYIIDMEPVPSFLNKNIQHFCLYPVCLAVKWLFGEETSPLLSLPTPRGGGTHWHTLAHSRNYHNRMRYFRIKLIIIKHCKMRFVIESLQFIFLAEKSCIWLTINWYIDVLDISTICLKLLLLDKTSM